MGSQNPSSSSPRSVFFSISSVASDFVTKVQIWLQLCQRMKKIYATNKQKASRAATTQEINYTVSMWHFPFCIFVHIGRCYEQNNVTLFANYSTCRICIFEFWHFPPIFVLLKLTCLVTLFDRKLQVFINLPKWTIFGICNELLSTQNVNVARFARNVEWDFFCDFQTPWTFNINVYVGALMIIHTCNVIRARFLYSSMTPLTLERK